MIFLQIFDELIHQQDLNLVDSECDYRCVCIFFFLIIFILYPSFAAQRPHNGLSFCGDHLSHGACRCGWSLNKWCGGIDWYSMNFSLQGHFRVHYLTSIPMKKKKHIRIKPEKRKEILIDFFIFSVSSVITTPKSGSFILFGEALHTKSLFYTTIPCSTLDLYMYMYLKIFHCLRVTDTTTHTHKKQQCQHFSITFILFWCISTIRYTVVTVHLHCPAARQWLLWCVIFCQHIICNRLIYFRNCLQSPF